MYLSASLVTTIGPTDEYHLLPYQNLYLPSEFFISERTTGFFSYLYLIIKVHLN